MDSISQIVLGAAVGEAVCGKRAGNKALYWGALAGTIPDLDILASPFLDMVGELTFHRSITHSFFFAFLVSPLLGWLVKKLYAKDETTCKDWTLLFFLGFTTHALLDSFTTWGTQLFYPFSSYGVAFHTIFVIDPLYTVPFLICTVAVLFYSRKDRRRRYWNYAGLILSCGYLMITVVNKLAVNQVFEKALNHQGVQFSRYSTKPTPFNTLLWNVTAEADSGYYIGYYSFLDKDQQIDFRYFPRNQHLLEPYLPNAKLQRLLDVTTGYYVVEKSGDSLQIKDLRFGQLDGWGAAKEDFTFVYTVTREDNGELSFSQKPNDMKKARELLGNLTKRIAGKENFAE